MAIQLLTADGCAVKIDGKTYAPAKGNILAYSGKKAGTVVLVMNGMMPYGQSFNYTDFRDNANATFASADAVLAYLQTNFKKATRRGDDTGSNKLASPQIGTITKSDTEFSIPVTNLPSGATAVWVLEGVTQSETGATLIKTSMTPETTYTGTVKFTKPGNTDSDVVPFSVTTDAAVGVPGPVRRWYINLKNQFSEDAAAPWNNVRFDLPGPISITPSLGTGNIGVSQQVAFSSGTGSVGSPSGALYSNLVINSAWEFQSPASILRLSGLTDGKSYKLYIGTWADSNANQKARITVGSDVRVKPNYHTYGVEGENEFESSFYEVFVDVLPTAGYIDISYEAVDFYNNYAEAIIVEEIGIVTPDPGEGEDQEKALINVLVDIAYWGDTVLDSGGQAAQEAEVIQTIPDAKGNHNLVYGGDASPDLGRPVKIGDGIDFYNQSQTYFSKASTHNLPEEFTIVFRHMPGQGWENIQGVYGAMYVGFGGGIDVVETGGGRGIRVLDSIIYVDQNLPLVYLQVCTIHVLFETYNTTGTKATVWYNGNLVGSVESETTYRRTTLAIGSNTNIVEHIFLGAFHKFSKLTDQERSDYLELIHAYFGLGDLPTGPYASAVQHQVSGNNHTCNYTYNGQNPENTAAVQYRWYERTGSAFRHTLVGTTKTITYAGGNTLLCAVKVSDNQGNSWRYVSQMI